MTWRKGRIACLRRWIRKAESVTSPCYDTAETREFVAKLRRLLQALEREL